MPLASPASPARNRRARTASRLPLASLFRPPGCEPKPVRFFNRPSDLRSHPSRLRREIAVRELRPSRIWLGFSSSRVRTKTCPLFSPARRRHPNPAMNSAPDPSDLFPDFSPVPQMVFVNERVSFQTEANQRVILVHGVVRSHHSREVRTAEAEAIA